MEVPLRDPAIPSHNPPIPPGPSAPPVTILGRPPGIIPRPSGPGFPVVRPPGGPLPFAIPGGRGASTSQILQNAAEMIAAARQIQQQRLLQQHKQQAIHGQQEQNPPLPGTSTGPDVAGIGRSLPPIKTGIPPTEPATGHAVAPGHSQPVQQPDDANPMKRKADALDSSRPVANTVMGVPIGTGMGLNSASAPHRASMSEEVGTSRGDGGPGPSLGGGQYSHSEVDYIGGNAEDGGDSSGDDEDGEGQDGKKVRLVWTQELHNRFINALSHLGLKHAVPKNILTMMNVEGMTRENVASHLQKYRLYLKKLGGYAEKDRIDSDVLQTLHEQNVQHLAAQQAMQHTMASATGGHFMGGPYQPFANAGFGGYPAVPYRGEGGAVSAILDIVEGIPVSDGPVDAHGSGLMTGPPVSPTVTAAVAAGGRFNPQGWQYPPMPVPDQEQPALMEPAYRSDHDDHGVQEGHMLSHAEDQGIDPGMGHEVDVEEGPRLGAGEEWSLSQKYVHQEGEEGLIGDDPAEDPPLIAAAHSAGDLIAVERLQNGLPHGAGGDDSGMTPNAPMFSF